MDFKAVKIPREELSLSNRLVLHEADFDELKLGSGATVQVNDTSLFSACKDSAMKKGCVGINKCQRISARIEIDGRLHLTPCRMERSHSSIHSLLLEMEFVAKNKTVKGAFNTDDMATQLVFECTKASSNFYVSKSHQLVLLGSFDGVTAMIQMRVVSMKVIKDVTKGTTEEVDEGFLNKSTDVNFQPKEGVIMRLTGKAKGKAAISKSIPLSWDFNAMGIGGLDNEFATIFRRAFASRVFPPELVEKFELKHVRGMLLFGPPGTGKTLIARKIGQLLNAREPKIVNGPEILDKYVGEAEANIRKLFAEAEEEHRKYGISSALHVIILDEIDAICKSRGSVAGSSGVHDTVVNQLLSKIDGVEELNNILVIGMTNRKDMIDEALLRPGRLEVQMEIGLPDEAGRVQILNIHTAKIKENGKLCKDVDIAVLAKETKNFSGAEIAGLVRAATSTAMHRLVKASKKIAELDHDAVDNLQVTRDDFLIGLEDIKPAFGASSETLDTYIGSEIIHWGKPLEEIFERASLLTGEARNGKGTSLVTVLLEGSYGSGTTALAAKIAQDSGFPFVRVCSAEKTIGFSEPAKCQSIKAIFDDAYKSPLSLIILDDIERLLDYSPLGPRYSNLALQALLVLLKKVPKKGRKILILGTTSRVKELDILGFLQVFKATIHVPYLDSPDQVMTVLRSRGSFTEGEMSKISEGCSHRGVHVGIKKLIDIEDQAVQAPEGKRPATFLSLMEGSLALSS